MALLSKQDVQLQLVDYTDRLTAMRLGVKDGTLPKTDLVDQLDQLQGDIREFMDRLED